LQARSGVMRAQGGPENPPVFLRIAVCDYTGAMLNAAAISMAIYHRERTGEGQRIETSLLSAGALINSEAFTSYKGRPPRQLADKGHYGLNALDRLYPTREGWLMVAVADDRDWSALCRALAREDLAADPRFTTAAGRAANDAALAGMLETVLAERTAEEWLADCEVAGAPVAPVVMGFSQALFSDPHALVGDFIVSRQHTTLGQLDMPGHLVRLSETPGTVNRAAPLLGEHTDEVLAELGHTPEQITDLRARRIVG
jgi:crotonobetainyl-CoA:carnitine CoA-transferase CaiB-like acyl-CoA transferase